MQTMHKALQRLQEYVWLFILWFVVVGIGVIGAFLEYQRNLDQFTSDNTSHEIQEIVSDMVSWELDKVATPPATTAQSIWLFDRKNNAIVYEKNSHTATSVASLAKLMTAIVSYELLSLDNEIPIASASQAIGNRAKFLSQDVFSVYDLLHALLIFSANDAAEALANAVPGGIEKFVMKMNEKAQELSLENTSYANPSGLDHSAQFSTAHDVGIIADTALHIPLLSEIVSQTVSTVHEKITGRIDTVYTTNALLYRNPEYKGMKTGTTERAGESLVVRRLHSMDEPVNQNNGFDSPSESEYREYDFLLVILGSENRFKDAEAIIEWARDFYTIESLTPESSVNTL